MSPPRRKGRGPRQGSGRVPDPTDPGSAESSEVEPGGARDTFARYRDRLSALGFRPSRSLGQNFLLDPTLHRAIADAADPGPDDTALEIGVGLGFLTRELARRAGRVVGVEVDERLVRIVREDLAEEGKRGVEGRGRVEIVHGDALGGGGGRLHPGIPELAAADRAPGGRLLVIANLPYRISGPIIGELCLLEPPADRMVLLVQKELADRLAAPPGSRASGTLTVLAQSLYRVRVVRKVGSEVFRPRPRVDSALLQLDLDPAAPAVGWTAARRARLRWIIQGVFGNRRKRLGGTLPAVLEGLGVADPGVVVGALPARWRDARPEALGPAEFTAILAAAEPAAASDEESPDGPPSGRSLP